MKVLFYFLESQNVTREKLPKRLLYEKGVQKMLMKLTAGDQKIPIYDYLAGDQSVKRRKTAVINIGLCNL